MSPIQSPQIPPSPPPVIVENAVVDIPIDTPPPQQNLEDFELGYSSLGVATVASLAFATAALIPSGLQSFSGCAALGITGVFWAKEALSTSPNKEFSLAAKQLTLAGLLLLPISFYTFTLQKV